MIDKKIIYVSACALFNDKNEVLLTQRPVNKEAAGLWEFPGGKLEAQETPEQALVREAKEELDITIDSSDLIPLTFVSHSYDNFHLVFFLYLCHFFKGELKGMEGQSMKWVNCKDLEKYPMPEADIDLIPLLQDYAENL